MSEIKQFKTESKRLLDLMIHSIYTNQEIFLRELISNASDAIDKYHLLSLEDDKLEKRNDYKINLSFNKEARTITIEDNGIGMTLDEINDNLGTIAQSGTLAFAKKMEELEREGKGNKDAKQNDLIGQFGVGFYSSFMVAKEVVVETKSPYSDKAYRFTSEGCDTYQIDEIDKSTIGSKIILFLRDNTEDNDYDKYLDEYTLRSLVKKYSDYVRYPIIMLVTHETPKLGEDGKPIEGEYNKEEVLETINSMVPLWKKAKDKITDTEVNEFYMQKFYDYQEPMMQLLFTIEGNINYTALLFIPKKPPYDLYNMNYEKGLQLYAKGVFIMDKCKDLIPDYLRFVKGLVDSSDLSLNISREMLQQNKVLQLMSKNIEKKILSKLEQMKTDEFDKYVEFFKEFGQNLKYGAYENYGQRKDQLKDLLLYTSLNEDKLITLKEYCDKVKEGQKVIYYVNAKSKSEVLAMPQMDIIKKHGYDVLILSEDIDEFVLKVLASYNNFDFKSINQGNIDDLATEEETKKLDELKESHKDLLDALKADLKDEVKDVILSKRLTDSPVCLVSGDGISFEMEKVMNAMPGKDKAENVHAEKILEVNPNHEIFKALETIYKNNPDDLKDYAELLFDQAMLMEGFPLKNPVEFSNKMCQLMIKANK